MMIVYGYVPMFCNAEELTFQSGTGPARLALQVPPCLAVKYCELITKLLPVTMQ